jgi:hypothetical protein
VSTKPRTIQLVLTRLELHSLRSQSIAPIRRV